MSKISSHLNLALLYIDGIWQEEKINLNIINILT